MQTFITLLSAGTALLDVFLVLSLAALLHRGWRTVFVKHVRANSLFLVFALSLTSIAGTLLMEYVGLLTPCMLCWWQRIFMYPIAIITGVALVKNVRFADIADYVLALSVPGFLIALYQHLLQMLPAGSLIPCDSSGDCAVRSVFEFGFVTIPWMALSVFATLIYIALVARKRE